MNKYIKAIIFLIAIGFLQSEFKGEVYARSGCCSHHGGVCGCGCCDGSALSSTCAPYYPECNGGEVKEPVRMVEPTAVPTRIPAKKSIPTARPTRNPTLVPTRKPSPTTKPTKIPTLIPTEVPVVTEKPIEIVKEIKPTEATISSEVAIKEATPESVKLEKVEVKKVKRHSLLSKMVGWWRRRG